jgi:hypothetical protein
MDYGYITYEYVSCPYGQLFTSPMVLLSGNAMIPGPFPNYCPEFFPSSLYHYDDYVNFHYQTEWIFTGTLNWTKAPGPPITGYISIVFEIGGPCSGILTVWSSTDDYYTVGDPGFALNVHNSFCGPILSTIAIDFSRVCTDGIFNVFQPPVVSAGSGPYEPGLTYAPSLVGLKNT